MKIFIHCYIHFISNCFPFGKSKPFSLCLPNNPSEAIIARRSHIVWWVKKGPSYIFSPNDSPRSSPHWGWGGGRVLPISFKGMK